MTITMRPITIEDIPFVYDLYQEPSIYRQAVLSGEELTREKIEEWVHAWLTSARHLHFVVQDEQGTPVGLNQLFAIDRVNRTCELGALLLPQAQGKGIVGVLIEHQIQIARDVLGIRELKIQVLASNTHSIHVAKKWGFEQEGVRKRAVYRDDEFHDILLFRKPVPQPVEQL